MDELTEAEIAGIMSDLGMATDQAADYLALTQNSLGTHESISAAVPIEEPEPPTRAWHHPDPADNPHGAWYVRTEISGAGNGKLAGRTVAVKDNLLLAGVPLMNGTPILEGYVPNVDAEIVTRILAEGGTITGKTVCEAYCYSGGSHTSAPGPVRNPRRPSHSAGGSSSGSAAVVANGDADMAIGCDQGGSIRMPASYSGIVGLKPTWGLVPYTGILGMHPLIDHTGPMTRNVADNALLLEVIAGLDGVDSRQSRDAESSYADAATIGDLRGVRIGLLREGFATPVSEADVDAAVRDAVAALEARGASVSEVSVPLHVRGPALASGLTIAMAGGMFHADGALHERFEEVPLGYIEKQRGWRDRADELPATVKSVLISAEVMRRRYGSRAVAESIRRFKIFRAAYDAALDAVDVLAMPTTPLKATPLPTREPSPAESLGLAFAPLTNTSVFNGTHHPALSVPCAKRDDLPVGLMLVGRHFDERTLYRIGAAVEDDGDWQER